MPIRWNGKSQGRTYLQNIHVTKALDSKYTKCYKSIIRGRQNLKKMCTWFANEQVQEKLFNIIHWSLRKCKLKPWRCTTTHSPEKLKLKTSDGKIWNNWNPYEPHMGMLNYIKKKKNGSDSERSGSDLAFILEEWCRTKPQPIQCCTARQLRNKPLLLLFTEILRVLFTKADKQLYFHL